MAIRNGVVGGVVGAGVVAVLGMAAGAIQLDPPDGPITETTASINDVLAAVQAGARDQGWNVASETASDGQIRIEGSGIVHRILVVPQRGSAGNASDGTIQNLQLQIDDLVVLDATDGDTSGLPNHSVRSIGEYSSPTGALDARLIRAAPNPVNIRFDEQVVVAWSTLTDLSRPRSPARVIVLYRLNTTP
ncbi:MAG: hypothetical protein AAGJ54_12150 [Planctomycetota bacterium]